MACLKVTGTASLEVGAFQVLTTPRPCSGCGSAKVPLTRRPGAIGLGSATVRVASPAEEITVAVVEAVYSLATPGRNGPKAAGTPSVSDSVAGTEPPTGSVG